MVDSFIFYLYDYYNFLRFNRNDEKVVELSLHTSFNYHHSLYTHTHTHARTLKFNCYDGNEYEYMWKLNFLINTNLNILCRIII